MPLGIVLREVHGRQEQRGDEPGRGHDEAGEEHAVQAHRELIAHRFGQRHGARGRAAAAPPGSATPVSVRVMIAPIAATPTAAPMLREN